MYIVSTVLVGKVNKDLVHISYPGGAAVGLSGINGDGLASSQCISTGFRPRGCNPRTRAQQRAHPSDCFCGNCWVGIALNINADTVSGEVAATLGGRESDPVEDPGSLVKKINVKKEKKTVEEAILLIILVKILVSLFQPTSNLKFILTSLKMKYTYIIK